MAVLYINGTILTMKQKETAQALLEEDGRILCVGTQAQCRQYAQGLDSLTIRDLKGQTLMPGLIDAHSHITALASTVDLVPLETADSISRLQELLAQAIRQRETEAGQWVQGFGYDHNFLTEHQHPTRQQLDQVSTQHPILIAHASGHMGVCNTLALEKLGITEQTPDPEGGKIGRDERGKLNGYLEETAFITLARPQSQPDPSALQRQLDAAQQIYLSYGITTAQDGMTTPASWQLLDEASRQDRLKLDVVCYWDMRKLSEMPAHVSDRARLRIGGVKIFLDGSPQGKTAWMSRPYRLQPDYCGYPVWRDDQVEAFVRQAWQQGWQLLAHCNGDAAADQLIRAVAAVEPQFPDQDLRPVMIHAQLVRPDQLRQMAALKMAASFFVAHTWYWGDIHLQNFGERGMRISPLHSALQAHVPFTLHQDTPVIRPDMLETVQCACRRITRQGQQLDPAERISVQQALEAVTINAAWQYHEEDRKGTLEAGKLADMIILDRNPLCCPVSQLTQIHIEETIKEGKTVYRRKPEVSQKQTD